MTGTGGVGMGMGPMSEMDDEFDLGADEDSGGEESFDIGDDEDEDMDMDMGDDMGDMGDMGDDLGADEEESVSVTRSEFEDAVRAACDTAWDKLSGGDGLDDLDGAPEGLDDDGEGDLDLDLGEDDMSDDMDGFGGEEDDLDMGDEDEEGLGECYGEEDEGGFPMESINRIAGLLTEDPDVFRGHRRHKRGRRRR